MKKNTYLRKRMTLLLAMIIMFMSLPINSYAYAQELVVEETVDSEDPVITLIGDSEMFVLQHHAYTELGATAEDNLDGDITNNIEVIYKTEDDAVVDDIDTSILDQVYKAEYTVVDAANNTTVVERTITVIADEIAPTLQLLGEFYVELPAGRPYVDAGAIAMDQEILDISDRIAISYREDLGDLIEGLDTMDTSVPGTTFQIVYQVSDLSGNNAEQKSRMVQITASEKPVITLNGESEVTILQNAVYVDAGVEVTDAEDTGLVAMTTITNPLGEVVDSIDTSIVGTYTVQYDAKDSDDNESVSKERKVHIVEVSAVAIKFISDKGNNVYIKTGTEPFNGGNEHIAGLDRTNEDEYVRTLDTVSYPLAYSVTNENRAAKDLKIVGTITDLSGATDVAKWDQGLSIIPNLTISADGKTFTYALGDVDGGQAFDFTATAYVNGTAKNGDQFTTQFKLVADNAEESLTEVHTSTVSAAPRVDLILKKGRDDVEKNSEGKFGITSTYSIGLSVKDGKGTEQLDNPINFTIDLENFGVPNVVLHENNPIGLNAVNHRVDAMPIGIFKTNEAEKSVFDSGRIKGTQNGAGQNITVEINDVDVTSGHYPTLNYNDSSISVDENYVFSGYLRLWVDYDDLEVGNNPVTLTYKDLKVTGISGLDNYLEGEEPLANNSHSHDIIKRETGDAGYGYRIDYSKSVFTNEKLETMTTSTSGDGSVVSGQTFAAGAYLSNGKFVDLSNTMLMTKFDPTVMELVDFDPDTVGDQVYRSYGALGDNYVVEFGVGTFSDYDDILNTTEPDNGIWYASYEEASAIGQVSMVRVRAINGELLKNNEYFTLNLNLRAKRNDIGTMLPVFAAVSASEVNGGQWTVGRYDPITNEDVTHGQRLKLTEVFVRIDKETKDKDLRAITLEDGKNPSIEYVLTPSITADSRLTDPKVSEDVIITDTLPNGMNYIAGSASLEPASVNVLPSGETEIVWDLGKNINLSIEPITYSVELRFDLLTNTDLVNTAVIESIADLSPEALRTDTRTITVINNQSWGIREDVLTPLVEINDPITYQILYGQFKNRDMQNFELISILPTHDPVYSEDGFTSYTGAYSLGDIRVENGEEVFATLDDPQSIDTDPKENTSTWAPLSEVIAAGDNEQITALKFTSPVFRSGEATRAIQITVNPTSNKEGDKYGTFTNGRTDAIDLPVKSKEVLARVVASSIGDTVWMDANRNGRVDSDEIRLENVKVILKQNGTRIDEQLTNNLGNYEFDNLHSGVYEVEVDVTTLPENVQQVYDPDATLDHNTTINLDMDEDNDSADFGYYSDSVATSGAIGDYIFTDIDKNGLQDMTDTGIEGVVVTLTKEGDASFQQTATTNAEGKYEFTNLELATYHVTVDETTLSDTLELSVDPDGDTLSSMYSVTLTDTTPSVMVVDFGYKESAVVNPQGTIGDYIFTDVDKNGLQDMTDTGIEGVVVTLTKEGDASFQQTATTNAEGKYEFTNLELATYHVTVDETTLSDTLELSVDPDGDTLSSMYSVTLTDATPSIMVVDFGYKENAVVLPQGQIGDFVYEDVNRNGQYDQGDKALESVQLEITRDNGFKAITLTDSSGKYNFKNLTEGTYKVRVIASSVDISKKLTIDPDGTIDGVHTVNLGKDQIIDTVDYGFSQKQPVEVPDDSRDETPDKTPDEKPEKTPDNTSDKESDSIPEDEVAKNGQLIVHHLDLLTNESLADSVESEGVIGSEYSTEAVQFEEYALVEMPTNKEGLYEEEKTVVIYYYTSYVEFEDEETPLSYTTLPKTGEKSNMPMMAIGVILLLVGVGGLLRRKKDGTCERV